MKSPRSALHQLRFNEEQIPVTEIELACPEIEGLSKDDYEELGEEVSFKLVQTRSPFAVLKLIRKKYKLKETEERESKIIRSPLPPGVTILEGSFACVSYLVGLLVEKFQYYQPLYRQHQRLVRAGIELSRGTLTSYMSRTILLLEPIYESHLSSIRSGSYLTLDETELKADRKSKGKMRKGYMFSMYGEEDEFAFVYSPSRSQEAIGEVLGEFKGKLLTDGLEGYTRYASKVAEIQLANCWSHTRRYFLKSEKTEPELSRCALEYIGKLYKVEKEIRKEGLENLEKLEYRVEHSKPVVDEFMDWLKERSEDAALLPSNPFTKAIAYTLRSTLPIILSGIPSRHFKPPRSQRPLSKKFK